MPFVFTVWRNTFTNNAQTIFEMQQHQDLFSEYRANSDKCQLRTIGRSQCLLTCAYYSVRAFLEIIEVEIHTSTKFWVESLSSWISRIEREMVVPLVSIQTVFFALFSPTLKNDSLYFFSCLQFQSYSELRYTVSNIVLRGCVFLNEMLSLWFDL